MKRRTLRLWVKMTLTIVIALGLGYVLVQFQNMPNAYEQRMNNR